jgi:hypothetical protein
VTRYVEAGWILCRRYLGLPHTGYGWGRGHPGAAGAAPVHCPLGG